MDSVKELKIGDIVLCRNTYRYLVSENALLYVHSNENNTKFELRENCSKIKLSEYTGMKHNKFADYDIVEVFMISSICSSNATIMSIWKLSPVTTIEPFVGQYWELKNGKYGRILSVDMEKKQVKMCALINSIHVNTEVTIEYDNLEKQIFIKPLLIDDLCNMIPVAVRDNITNDIFTINGYSSNRFCLSGENKCIHTEAVAFLKYLANSCSFVKNVSPNGTPVGYIPDAT